MGKAHIHSMERAIGASIRATQNKDLYDFQFWQVSKQTHSVKTFKHIQTWCPLPYYSM